MDKETFSIPKVLRKMNRKFISIRINTDSRTPIRYKGAKLLPKRLFGIFRGRGVPYNVFLDQNSDFLINFNGFIDKDNFYIILKKLEDYLRKKK